MKIDIEALAKITKDADKIFLKPEGERALIKLLEIEQQVKDAISAAKEKLEKAALKVDPNFSSIQSDNIKVFYRSYGPRYYVAEGYPVGEIDPELYEVKHRYFVNTKAVDEWTKEHKGMPAGIVEASRPKSLTFSLKRSAK